MIKILKHIVYSFFFLGISKYYILLEPFDLCTCPHGWNRILIKLFNILFNSKVVLKLTIY